MKSPHTLKEKKKKSIIMQINCFKEIIPRISIFGVALNKIKSIDNQLNIWDRLTEPLFAVHIVLEIRETRTGSSLQPNARLSPYLKSPANIVEDLRKQPSVWLKTLAVVCYETHSFGG